MVEDQQLPRVRHDWATEQQKLKEVRQSFWIQLAHGNFLDKFWLAVRVALRSNSCSVTLFSCELWEFAKHVCLLLSWKTYHILKRGLAGLDQGATCITANWASDVTGQGPRVLSSSAPFSLCVMLLWSWVCVCLLSCFSWVQLFAILWDTARQAPLSMGFSRKEYWSGLPCPPPGDLPNAETEPTSLVSPALAGGCFTITWEAWKLF